MRVHPPVKPQDPSTSTRQSPPITDLAGQSSRILVEKGLVDLRHARCAGRYLRKHKSGRATARRWWREPGSIPHYKKRLLADAHRRIAELGYRAAGRPHGRRREHTEVHNLVVCTLCSCYPWPVLGLPPVWYKSAPYRSRAVIDPRGVLRSSASNSPKMSRCASGTAPPSCATWSCPSARRAPRI